VISGLIIAPKVMETRFHMWSILSIETSILKLRLKEWKQGASPQRPHALFWLNMSWIFFEPPLLLTRIDWSNRSIKHSINNQWIIIISIKHLINQQRIHQSFKQENRSINQYINQKSINTSIIQFEGSNDTRNKIDFARTKVLLSLVCLATKGNTRQVCRKTC